LAAQLGYSQPDTVNNKNIVDRIIAIVGDEIILESDLEMQYLSQFPYALKGMPEKKGKCIVLEDLLYQKLLLNQAKIDSIEITSDQVEAELERRMRFFVSQIGSEQKLEAYYGKSILEIKNEFKDMVKNQLLTQKMQAKTTENIQATPSEVREYFENIPADSLPFINSEMAVAHIVAKPPISEEEEERIKMKLEDLRKRILNGENFGTLAYMYSEDPISAMKNGELDFVQRGDLVPEFEAVAFNLKKDEVSEVIKTQFGYHLLQLIERRGDKVNVRHILQIPKVSNTDLQKASAFLDSLQQIILLDTLTFSEAAEKHSDDEMTKMNGGSIINLQTGTSKFEAGQMDPLLAFAVDKMKVGEISAPTVMNTDEGKQAYRLIKLISRTDPHMANLKDDYQRIQDETLSEKQTNTINNWIHKKQRDTYIKVDDEYGDCNFTNNWVTP